jgi:hypothetical protein
MVIKIITAIKSNALNIVRNIIISIALWPALLFSQTTFYVSGKGNETNHGTKTRPFASIERALIEARKTPGSVTIYLFDGTYYLEKPIVFTSEDSRKENETLTLTNFENQKVTVSGGAPLNLKWEPYRNGIWRARVEQDLLFDELFVNGQLQRMARYPNYDPSARFLGGTAADAVSKERSSGWNAPEGGYVHALHRSEWGDFHYIITGKNDNGELVLEGGWQNNRRNDEIIDFIGAKIKNLNTAGERSATGMDDARSVLVVEVTSGSGASEFLQTNDIIISINNIKTNNLRDLLEARMSVIGTNTEIIVFRNQKEIKILMEIKDK